MEPLHVFEPIKTSLNATTWSALFITVLALGGAFLLLKKKTESRNRNMQQMGAMLLFFVGIIALSTAFFNFWASQRTSTLKIYKTAIEINGEKIPFQQIKGAYIHVDQQKSFINPALVTDSNEILVIEEKNGKTTIFSEEYYEIRKIIGHLKPLLQK